jgi:hypothetical protein
MRATLVYTQVIQAAAFLLYLPASFLLAQESFQTLDVSAHSRSG